MPRKARIFSESGYMHVTMRGIGKQLLFEDNYDYYFFLGRMKIYFDELDIEICAYCLMSNHVHILIKDDNQKISLAMKKLGVSYSRYFNDKYDRTGHLFQDRYHSEPIENSAYLLSAFRYILRNPIKARIYNSIDYTWNSYNDFINHSGFTKTDMIWSMFLTEDDVNKFLLNDDEDDSIITNDHFKGNDNKVADMIKSMLEIENLSVLKTFDKDKRNYTLSLLKDKGIPIRQISRLTGFSRGIVQRA